MPLNIARASISRIDCLESQIEYIYIATSNGVNEQLQDLVKRRPYVDEAHFQIHQTTLDIVGLIIKLKPLVRYNDVIVDTTKVLKLWHEIETGWLYCRPPLEINTVHKRRPVKELFEPQKDSIGYRLGRTIAQKEWAIIESKVLMVSLYARRESDLRRQLA